MVITCTVRSILQQLTEQGVTASYGAVLSLCPFFITFATEKETALCLCKLCLNTRMLFEPQLLQQAMTTNNQYQINVCVPVWGEGGIQIVGLGPTKVSSINKQKRGVLV